VEFYSDPGEEIRKDLPPEQGPSIRMIVYVANDYSHDLVPIRSITGNLVVLYNTPIRCVSKHQNIVETSTYGSKLLASKISMDLMLEARYMLRSLRVSLERRELILGVTMSVILNARVPSSVLKRNQYCSKDNDIYIQQE
jgi:hypothetical protein